ncbi:MAG: ribonuclease III [Chloroflexota bacterium]
MTGSAATARPDKPAASRSRKAPGSSAPPPAEPAPSLIDEDTSLLRPLMKRLGIRFKDPALLRLALTHRSVIQDAMAAGMQPSVAAVMTNERLEFLGDAILGAVAAEYLYGQEPAVDEGTLTRHRVALVRAETLVRWARELELGESLYLGPGERPSGGARDRMLAGAFEAIVGAVFIDRGFPATRRWLMNFIERDAPGILSQPDYSSNPKGRLQEGLQDRSREGPTYRTSTAAGPAHAPVFTVEAAIGSRRHGVGTGASKREAQQAAAAAALRGLEQTGTAGEAGTAPGEDGPG